MSKRERLTKSRIKQAEVPPDKQRQIVLWDAVVGGLGVRCLPSCRPECSVAKVVSALKKLRQ
jgi:hypothetical protein